MAETALQRAGVYERTAPVSLARIWENVLDWEHLPWLHGTSFAEIACHDIGPWGWRGTFRQKAKPELWSEVEVKLDRPNLRYVTRTIGGFGKGNEIWTYLKPIAARETEVRVEFLFADLPADKADEIGAAYARLYTTLWDEDVDMMRRRDALLDRRGAGPTGSMDLGTLAEVRARLPFTVEWDGRPYRVVEVDGRIVAFCGLCPHMLGPLEDGAVDGREVTCPWHGYRFDVVDGKSTDGRGLAMKPAPEVVIDEAGGHVNLVWPAAD